MAYVISDATVINTTTANTQASPQIATLSDFGWVVTWTATDADGSTDIVMQAYNADGTLRGSETTVNTTTTGEQRNQHVAALDNGGWTVVWESYGQDAANSWGLYQQVFDSSGSKPAPADPFFSYLTISEQSAEMSASGDQINPEIVALATTDPSKPSPWVIVYEDAGQVEFVVDYVSWSAGGLPSFGGTVGYLNQWLAGTKSNVHVAALGGGGFVAVWQSTGSMGDLADVYVKAYGADFQPMSGYADDVLANQDLHGIYQGQPTVTALEGGGWVVGWTTVDQDTGAGVLQQKVYGSDGVALGNESLVDTDNSMDMSDAMVTSLDGGGWVVTWQGGLGSDADLYQQVFNADGTRLGSRVEVNSTTANAQDHAQVTELSNGGWVTVWRSHEFGQAGYTVDLQIFNNDGSKKGNEVEVYTDSTDVVAALPKITTLDSGSFVVVWTAYGVDGSNYGIVQKTFFNQNEAPTGTDKTVTISEDATFSFSASDFGFADGDGNALAAVIITALPSAGTLALDGTAVTLNQEISAADLANLTWTPPANKSGDALGSFAFEVRDDGGTAHGGIDTDATQRTFVFDVTPVVDVIKGDDNANKLKGTVEDDILQGLGGNDDLDGRAGKDRMEGGDGDDTYHVDNVGDHVIEKKNQGTDIVLSSVSFGLDANVENLTLIGKAAIDATGNTLDNELAGNAGNNRLDGKGGNDVLVGGGGNDDLVGGAGVDTLTGGAGHDAFIFSAKSESGTGAKADVVTDFKHVDDDIDLSAFAGAFRFLGAKDFDGKHANELRFETSGKDLIVQLDIDGNAKADVEIVLQHVTSLVKSDFIL